MYGELKARNEKEPQHRGSEFQDNGIPEYVERKQKPYVSSANGVYSVLNGDGKEVYRTRDKTLAHAWFKKNYDKIKEAYDIGHDYAKYTSSITPGEKHYNPKFQGTTYTPSKPSDNLINVNAKEKVELKDIEEWATKKETIDKYKERYGEEWQSKIEETYEKMFSKVIDTNSNMQEGRMKEIAIDLMSKEKGGLDADEFQRKYNKSKAEMQKDLGTPPSMPKKSFKEFAEEVNEWGILPSTIVEAEYQGKKVKLNDPIRGGYKKFYVSQSRSLNDLLLAGSSLLIDKPVVSPNDTFFTLSPSLTYT